jgi:hypothetical protein
MAAAKKATRARGRSRPAGVVTPAARLLAVSGGRRERSDEGRQGEFEPAHVSSPTAVAAEALRTGVVPHAVPRARDDDAIPGEAERIRAGDPDDETLGNEYVGEETPGGSTPTPDQGNVDDIGRAYGVQEEDSGALRTSTEVMEGRDQRRRGLSVRRRRP